MHDDCLRMKHVVCEENDVALDGIVSIYVINCTQWDGYNYTGRIPSSVTI